MTPTVSPERTVEQIRVDALVLERVKKGYALLQEKHGDDWVDHIDLRKLDLSSGSCCILGQLYSDRGTYAGGCTDLWGSDRGTDPQARDHGFLASGTNDEYGILNEIWQALIEGHYGREVELIGQ